MTTDTLPCANLNGTSGTSAIGHTNATTLRFDDLTRVLVNLEKRVCVPIEPKRRGKARTDHGDITQLRADVVNFKAEYERVITSITEDLDEFADRIAGLEARARRPFWRRSFGNPGDSRELAGRSRRKLTERLKSIFLDRPDGTTPIRAVSVDASRRP